MRRVYCDRCDSEINRKVEPLFVVRPPRNRHDKPSEPLDLCKKCADSFRSWINPPRAAREVGNG